MTRQRVPYETMEGGDYPTVRQLSVFLENRLGQLLRLTQLIEKTNVRILGLSVRDSVDCAVVRLLFDKPDDAIEVLKKAGFAVSVSELLIVKLPPGKRGMMTIWSSLMSSEINVSYAYSLLRVDIGPAIALSVDNIEIAVDTLQRRNFEVMSESDLSEGP